MCISFIIKIAWINLLDTIFPHYFISVFNRLNKKYCNFSSISNTIDKYYDIESH